MGEESARTAQGDPIDGPVPTRTVAGMNDHNDTRNSQDPAAPAPEQPTEADASPKTHLAIVHDGNGTWFEVSGLAVVAITDDELEDLEQGFERLLDQLPAVNLIDILPQAFTDQPYIRWT